MASPLIFFKIQNFLIIVIVVFLFRIITGKITFNKLVFILFFIIVFIGLKDYRINNWTLGQYFSLEARQYYKKLGITLSSQPPAGYAGASGVDVIVDPNFLLC